MQILEKLDLFVKGYLIKYAKPNCNAVQPSTSNLKGCLFEDGVHANAKFRIRSGSVFIGAYSYLNIDTLVRSSLFIGRYCSIGSRVSIPAGIHAHTKVSTHPIFPAVAHIQCPTILKNDVWVGDGAIIKAGITIGNGAIIGANSVVTKDVPDYAIVGGAPAKIIKYRFSSYIISHLLESLWWEYPKDFVLNYSTLEIEDFLIQFTENCITVEKQKYLTYTSFSETQKMTSPKCSRL